MHELTSMASLLNVYFELCFSCSVLRRTRFTLVAWCLHGRLPHGEVQVMLGACCQMFPPTGSPFTTKKAYLFPSPALTSQHPFPPFLREDPRY